MKLLYQHSPSISERYEKWGEKHPILQMGGEMAAQYALDQLGPGVLKRLPGAFRTAGHVWEMIRDQGGLGDWASGGKYQRIADPHLKLSGVRKVSNNNYEATATDTRTGQPATVWELRYDPNIRQVYIKYARTPGAVPARRGRPAVPAYGVGHYRHTLRELTQQMKALHPEIETVKFYRNSGAGPNNTGETELVTAPVDLFLPRSERRKGVEAQDRVAAEGEGYPRNPEMFAKMVEGQQKKKGSRIIREGRPSRGRRWEPLPEQGQPGRYRVSQRVEERRPYHEHQNSELDDVINQLGDFEAIPETEPSPYAPSRRSDPLTPDERWLVEEQVRADPEWQAANRGYVEARDANRHQVAQEMLDRMEARRAAIEPRNFGEADVRPITREFLEGRPEPPGRQQMEDDWESRGEEGPTFAEEDAARARPFRGTPMTMDEFLTDLRNNPDQYLFPHPLGAAVERGEIPVPQSQADIDNFDAQRHERYPEIGDARTHLQVMDQRAQELVRTRGVPIERVHQFEDAHAVAQERYHRALNEAETIDERVRAIREIGAGHALDPADAAQAYYEMFSPNPEDRPPNLDRQISRALDIVYEDPQDQPMRRVPEPIGTGWNEEELPQEEWPRPAFEQGTRTTLTGRTFPPTPVPREAGGMSDEEWRAFLGRGTPAAREMPEPGLTPGERERLGDFMESSQSSEEAYSRGPRPEPGYRERQDQELRWQARDEQPLPLNRFDRAQLLTEERRAAEAEGPESYRRWMEGLPARERRAGITSDIDFSQFENPAPTERQREEAAESGLLPGESFDQAYQRQGGAEGFRRWLRGEEDPVGEGMSRQRERGMFGPTLEETASRQRPLAPHEQTILDRINEQWDPDRPRQRPDEPDEHFEARQRRWVIERERRTPLDLTQRSMVSEEDPALRGSWEEETREQQQQRLLAGGAPRNDAEREMRRRYLEQQTQAPQERERLRRITPEVQARIDAFAQEVREFPDAYPGGTEMLEAIRRGEAEVPNSQEDIDAWLARRGRR